jgi:hypothetical protein
MSTNNGPTMRIGGKAPLSLKEKARVQLLAEALLFGFDWASTPNGAEYWSRVWENLNAIANEKEARNKQ